MNKKTKIWLIVATSLIFVGIILFGGVMMKIEWDFSKLSTVKYETNRYEIGENYKNIKIVTGEADIVLVPAEDLRSEVVCYEQINVKHSVIVKDDTLVIEAVDTRKWYHHIGIHFDTPSITVSIPQGEYGELYIKSNTGDVEIPKDFKFKSIDITESTGDVTNEASALEFIKIKTTTGDIEVKNVSASALDLAVSTGKMTAFGVTCEGNVEIRVSTGRAKITDVRCKNVISSGNTGDISLKNVIAAEKITIERSTGDVRFDECDAAELFVKTSTGSVKGTLLSDKIFMANTDTGRVDIPGTNEGGICEIKTSTGDIIIQKK